METKVVKNPNQGKRKSVKNAIECKFELKEVLPRLFGAFNKSVKLYNKEITLTPVDSRGRGFAASYLNSKIIQCIKEEFSDNCFFGKYRRFILRKDGYLILFKKLNRANLPMNVKTKNTIAIENQMMRSLFEDQEDIFEPVVFLGYRTNSLGELSSPKLVYIDEGKCVFEIIEKDLIENHVANDIAYIDSRPATPMKVKSGLGRKKDASGM